MQRSAFILTRVTGGVNMICSRCGSEIQEGKSFCGNCGASVNGNIPPYVDPYDHTEEFEKSDVSENKVYCMLPYLMGILGSVATVFLAKDSAYAKFHIKESVKLAVVETLLGLISALLCWTIIIPILGGICVIILFVLRIICFFQVCGGKAKEVAIIRSLGFLK